MGKSKKAKKPAKAEWTLVERRLSESTVPPERLTMVAGQKPAKALAFEAMLDKMRVVFDPSSFIEEGEDRA